MPYTIAQLERYVSSAAYNSATADALAQRLPELPTYKGEQIAPGITRIHGNLCNVHGKYGPCDAAAKPKKGRVARPKKAPKPKQTPAQRAQARQQQRQANVDSVANRMADSDTGLSPSGAKALGAFAQGQQPDASVAEGLAKMGLAEQASDGSYRMTPTGRAVVSAMQAGDYERTIDTISRGTDASSARQGRQAAQQTRQQATAQRRADVAARRQQAAAQRAARQAKRPAKTSAGGSKKPEARPAKAATRTPIKRGASAPSVGPLAAKPKLKPVTPPKPAQPAKATPQIAPALQTAAQALSDGAKVSDEDLQKLITNGLVKLVKGAPVLTLAGQRATKKEFFSVFKDASGGDRWLMVSSTAYRDRDLEIVSSKALQSAVAQADASGMRGPLRFWHVPGLDLGDCDYQATAQDGRFLIESGTFRSPALAAAVKSHADDYQVSIGFVHPTTEPDAENVYHHITIFERSLVPRGRAANPLTRVVITKELRMLTPEKEAQLKSLTAGDPTLLADLLSRVATTDKAAQDAGATYKDDLRALIREELASLLTEKASNADPAEVAPPDRPPGMKADGIEGAEDPSMEDSPEDLQTDATEYLSDLSVADFESMLSNAFSAALAPLVKSLDIAGKMAGHMDELKGMMGGYTATKDDAIAKVTADVEAVKAQVADLSGSQPRIMAGGFRASQSAATITTDDTKIKEAGPKADPTVAAFGAFMQDLGFAGPVQGV